MMDKNFENSENTILFQKREKIALFNFEPIGYGNDVTFSNCFYNCIEG